MPLPDSLSLEILKKDYIDKQLSADDDILTSFLESAFEQAQAPPPFGCGRLLVPDSDEDPPVEKRIRAHGRRRLIIPDAREITEVLADDVPVTEYELFDRDGVHVRIELPRIGNCYGYENEYEYYRHRRLPKIVTVKGRFGFASIPPNLLDAIYILAARYWYERDAQYADQVPIAEGAAIQTYYRQLPPRTKLVFATYTVPQAVAGL